MESPDTSSYALSPERHPKRAGPPPDYPSTDGAEKFTHVKFLVSNGDAGSVIGKGGSTITEFQTLSGARIQLSRSNEFFPGTGDRIIMISGATHEVLKAMELILFKLSSEINTDGGGEDFDQKCKVRLIVPNSCCGGIIGKGGVTIKSFIEDSQAGIKISPQDNSFGGGLNDRLVTLTGSVEEQMHAIDLILCKLTEDPHYSQSSSNSPYSYSSFHPIPYTYVIPSVGTAGYGTPMNYGPNGASPGGGSGRFHGGGKEERGTATSITIGIADEHVGFVVGRGGRIITEISQSCGARIKISDRGDFLPGTSNRKVTISGSERAVRAAENMIMQQVDLAGER